MKKFRFTSENVEDKWLKIVRISEAESQQCHYKKAVGKLFPRKVLVVVSGVVNVGTWASSAIPDVPTNGLFNDEHIHSLENFVNEVSSDWCCHLVEGNTLAIFLPFDQRTWNLSKGAFVSLLEFCENNLPVKRILLCISKGSVDETVVSCFKYLGFSPLHPHSYPSCIDPQGVFAMVYNM